MNPAILMLLLRAARQAREEEGYEPWPLPDVKTPMWCNVAVWVLVVSAVLLVVAWIVGTVYILSGGRL